MIQLTTHELQKASLMKAGRHAIRLKHSLNADAEINEKMPGLEKKIDAALLSGKALTITMTELLDNV